jgi:hypothetical protein
MLAHFFRTLIAIVATAGIGYVLYYLLPAVVSSTPLDGGSLAALGFLVGAYGFLMAYLLNPKYRAEMDGPAPKSDDASPPDQAA